MKIFITGVACVGKSSIGKRLAERMKVQFFDLDHEIENFYGLPLGRIYNQYLTVYSYRKACSKALEKIIENNTHSDYIMAISPAGLHAPYYRMIRKTDGIVLVLKDTPENIVNRVCFYDDDSNPVEMKLTTHLKKEYIKEIKKDMTYFKPFHKKADYHINIEGLNIDESAQKIEETLASIQ